ncbi:MBL fold metallo-hydrolase [Desulfovibrio sp. OttesenSCG-928-F20]|nr:MBL fold metallo-hydrolase [Desulfovibrio sp. OttesenSCG-928-F20]
MNVTVFPLGPLDTNCFVIHTQKEALVVDPGGPPDELLDFLQKNGLNLTHVLLSHLHFDHTYGVAELVRQTGAEVLGPEGDRYMLSNEMGLGGIWGLPGVEPYEYTVLKPGPLHVLDTECTVLSTPGHTPGGLSFYFPALKAVFSGDTLFYRSIGRSDFPGGDQKSLEASIRQTLYGLPDETVVYCGHGLQTSIGDERRNNPYVSDFS